MRADDIIDTFGGTSALAKLLDLKASTVHSWRIANYIPEWRQTRLLELALELKKPIGATDFPPISERISAKRVAA
jgi:hypothetical protein